MQGTFLFASDKKSSFTIWPNPDTIIVEKSEVKNGIRECAALKTPFSLPLDCSLKTPIQNFSVSQTLISPGITILWKICIAKPHNWGKFSSKTSYWVKKLIHKATFCSEIQFSQGSLTLHPNCITVPIYRLFSAASHRSIATFQVKMYLTFLRHRNAVTSQFLCSRV